MTAEAERTMLDTLTGIQAALTALAKPPPERQVSLKRLVPDPADPEGNFGSGGPGFGTLTIAVNGATTTSQGVYLDASNNTWAAAVLTDTTHQLGLSANPLYCQFAAAQAVTLTSTTITGNVAVTIATLPALTAGSAVIGKVGIDQTTNGTTNAVAAHTDAIRQTGTATRGTITVADKVLRGSGLPTLLPTAITALTGETGGSLVSATPSYF
jgi:hypothetical protein